MTESVPRAESEARKRRSIRIVQAVPLTVTGVDALGRPFQERTSTLIVNCHGCRYQSKHYVLKNMWVTLEVPHPEAGREPRSVRARVTWIQRPRTVRELFQVAVELEVPGNIWGIAFPPEDWFPFPEIPEPALLPSKAEPGEEWEHPEALPATGNLRMMPAPAGAETSAALAREMARLVGEAKQELQDAIRESVSRAVGAETQPLLASIQSHIGEAAEKSVREAAATHLERAIREALARVDAAAQATAEKLREEWERGAERHVQSAGQKLLGELAQTAEAQRAGFGQQLQATLDRALESLKGASREIAGRVDAVQASAERLRGDMEEAAESAGRRWQHTLAEEQQKQREGLKESARQLKEEIAATAGAAEASWRQRLEEDLAAAARRWDEKAAASLERAAQLASGSLAQHSQAAVERLEAEFSGRVENLRKSFEQMARRLEEHAARLDARSQTTGETLEQRLESFLATTHSQLDQRVETAVAGLADRLQPLLQVAGQQSVVGLATQLEQQFGPHWAKANELLQELATTERRVEETLRAHRERVLEVSGQSVQDLLGRLHDATIRFERDFQEAGRAATAKWLAELDEKASEATHTTFESLYKTAEWYQKKVQTQMQGTLDKGLEQAIANLRERAGEISGLFASELDHYSRNYVDHAQGQMEEGLKDMLEQARTQLAGVVEITAASFGDEAHRVAQNQFEQFSAATSTAAQQTAAQLEARAAQVRTQMEEEARQFHARFQQSMTEAIQRGVQQARQELEAQVAPAQQALRAEREAQEQRLRDALHTLGHESVESYKTRLENVTNPWLVTTFARLNQQSQQHIDALAAAADERLRETCSQVFANVAETLRQRMLEFVAGLAKSPQSPEPK